MPVISMFQGILIRMFFKDNDRHASPHVHAEYQGAKAAYDIATAAVLAGEIPPVKHRLVVAWIELHRDELLADWQLAVEGLEPFRIDPLR